MLLTLIVGVLINYFILYNELGLGAFLAVLLMIGYHGYFMHKNNQMDKGWWMKSLYIGALSATFILRDMMVFKVLIFISIPLLFATMYMDFKNLTVNGFIVNILTGLFKPVSKMHLLTAESSKKIFSGRKELRQILVGVIIAIPFLMIVVPLLIASDLILEDMTVTFLEGIEISAGFVFRIIFIIFVSSYLYGQIHIKKISQKIKKAKNDVSDTVGEIKEVTDHSLIMKTFLVVINLVYGFYVYIQIRYLFLQGGQLPGGITYAEYAREGFFQLLAVAIINVLMVLIVEYFNKKNQLSRRILESLTLLMTIVMSVSAFYRMHLYEQTYGYTRLRLLVFMFLIFLIVFMIMFCIYLMTHQKKMIPIITIFMMVFFLGSAWMNVDGFVAKQNVLRYEETGEIDLYYLLELSDDAHKVVDQFIKDYPELSETYAYQNRDIYEEEEEKESYLAFNLYKQ